MSYRKQISLKHLRRLTDDTGLIQHAVYSVPRREDGYASDDNARALLFAAREFTRTHAEQSSELAATYLAFLQHAQDKNGHFRNLMSYDRRWIDTPSSDDCQGRCLWAMAEVCTSELPDDMRRLARELFERGVWQLDTIRSPRAVAISLMALEAMHQSHRHRRECVERAERGAQFLLDCFEMSSSNQWVWFEAVLAYANARLPHGLLCAYRLTGDERLLKVAATSLDFLLEETTRDGLFVPIGNDGWLSKGGARALYDQQPIEAATMVEASGCAYAMTKKASYREAALRALAWFYGKNTAQAALCDEERGSCRDGLSPEGPNLNEGAESTVAYLLSLQTVLLYNIPRE